MATNVIVYNIFYVTGVTGSSGPQVLIGSGNPEGVVSAISGSLYTDWFNKAFYQKITGSSINGWI
jgi:hypothetical protein